MPITYLYAVICIPLVLFLNLSNLQKQIIDSFGSTTPLDIREIRIYGYQENSIPDYHVGEIAWDGGVEGRPVVINGLVRNQNHTTEHFDYITQIIDPDGYTIHIDTRMGVAVPLGHELGIDSGNKPLIFNQTGTYIVKVFAWRNLATIPEPLSEAAIREIHVTILP